MGLDCRMQLGWKHDHEALAEGVAFLDQAGPSTSNLYFDYYATEVMFHYGGKPWERWNARLRDKLVETQDRAGVKAGSWHFKPGDHGAERGGRLYCTALAALILETYYRQPRIYAEP